MQMREQDLIRLDEVCRKYNVPLLIARSYGLVGYLRVSVAHLTHLSVPLHVHMSGSALTSSYMQASLPEHTVIESKPDNALEDLRYAWKPSLTQNLYAQHLHWRRTWHCCTLFMWHGEFTI